MSILILVITALFLLFFPYYIILLGYDIFCFFHGPNCSGDLPWRQTYGAYKLNIKIWLYLDDSRICFCKCKISFKLGHLLHHEKVDIRTLQYYYTSCYVQCWPQNLIPWPILYFQPLWVIDGHYSSRNPFYLAVFEIAELVGI